MRQVLAALFVLLSFPVFMFGGGFLVSAVKLHWGQPFYASSSPEDFALYAAIWVGMALLVLVPSALVLLRKNAPATLLVLPLLLLLLTAIAIPSNIPPGYRGMMAGREVERRMKSAATALEKWGGEHGQLPQDESQLLSAVEPKERPGEDAPTNSRYQRGGQPVPYRFLLMANAPGPHRPQPPLEQPAVVHCAISPDRKKFWLTATGLPDDVSREVVVLESDGQMVTVGGEVPAKVPEPLPSSTPGKKPKMSAPTAK